MLSLRAAALTDIGRVRRVNEDRFVCDPKALLFGVADGVGGLPGGAEAAELTINEITAAFSRISGRDEPNLPRIVQRANAAVAQLGQKLSPSMGIGTTLTFAHIQGGTLKLAHVGDSRCYLAHARDFIQLTEDHSVENEARLRRARGEAVYYHESNRNALTRCIGQPGRVEVDLISRPLARGDRYLFCTDGVTRMIADDELAGFLTNAATPDEALQVIVSTAVTRGGPDNATAVSFFVDTVA